MRTITVDGVEYSEVSRELGKIQIIVADRGWVFVGAVTDNDDGSVRIDNCQNIRVWGTTKGLGELVDGPTAKTLLDDYGTVHTRPIVRIAVSQEAWA